MYPSQAVSCHFFVLFGYEQVSQLNRNSVLCMVYTVGSCIRPDNVCSTIDLFGYLE